jgi:hypothetical protein
MKRFTAIIILALSALIAGSSWGAVGTIKTSDVITSDDVRAYPSLAAACASAKTSGKIIRVKSGTTATLSADLTPGNRTIVVEPGGYINQGAYTISNLRFQAGDHQVFTGTGAVTFDPGYVQEIKAAWMGQLIYGTGISGANQTINTATLQRAINTAVASSITLGMPGNSAVILVNDSLTSVNPVKIDGHNVRMLQTAAGKYVFYLGKAVHDGSYTFGYALKDMHLASADVSAGNVFLGEIIQSNFENVVMTGAGLYGWTLSGVQELHFRNCNNSGIYRPLITGQNMTGSSNGVWGNGSTTGAAWRITGATTTVYIEGDCSDTTSGIISDSTSLVLKYYGTIQGVKGKAIADQSGMYSFDINAYTEDGGTTPGGIYLVGSRNGKIFMRNSDTNGVQITGGSNIHLSGYINTVSVDASSSNITGENIVYSGNGGYIKDLSPDGRWINLVKSGSAYLTYGIKGNPKISLLPNSSLERWHSTTVPCGFSLAGATVSKEGGMVHSGLYSAKIVGGATNEKGIKYFLGPIAMFTDRYVTITGWHNSAEDWFVWYYKDNGAESFSHTIKASGGNWAPFVITVKIAADDALAYLALCAAATKTIYIDDVDILTESFDIVGIQTLGTTTTPSVTAGASSVPHYLWKFDNSAPTSVTNFGGGYGGKEYTFILDANTTLVDGATLQLRGGANKSGAGTVIKLFLDSENAVWYQTGYESVN